MTTSIFCRRRQGARHTIADDEGYPSTLFGRGSTEPLWSCDFEKLGCPLSRGKTSSRPLEVATAMLIRPVLSIGLRRLVLVATAKETTRSIRKNHDRPWDRSCKGEEDPLQNCAVVEPSPTLPALRSQTLPTPSSSGRPCDHHGPSQPKKNELVSYSDHRDSFDPRPNQEVPAWRHATEKAGLLELSGMQITSRQQRW